MTDLSVPYEKRFIACIMQMTNVILLDQCLEELSMYIQVFMSQKYRNIAIVSVAEKVKICVTDINHEGGFELGIHVWDCPHKVLRQ